MSKGVVDLRIEHSGSSSMCGYSRSMGIGIYGYNNSVCSYGAAGCVVHGLVSPGLSCIQHLVSLHLQVLS